MTVQNIKNAIEKSAQKLISQAEIIAADPQDLDNIYITIRIDNDGGAVEIDKTYNIGGEKVYYV